MDPQEDLYRVLGVSQGADGSAIKAAYRRLSMENHPDRNPGDEQAGGRFARIGQAYEVLGNPELRRRYDEGRIGADGQQTHESPLISEELLSAMFGSGMGVGGGPPGVRVFHMGGAPGMGPPPGMPMPGMRMPPFGGGHDEIKDVEERVKITIEQAFSGCTVPINVRRWIVAGQAEREERETLYVTIRQGADNDEILRIEGKGNIVEGRKGDVKVFVDVENKSAFKRAGLDLHYKCRMALRDALSCPPVEIQHLDGRTFRMKGTGGVVSPGSKKTLRGLGMVREGEKGNMIVHYEVLFPSKLSTAQVQAIQAVL